MPLLPGSDFGPYKVVEPLGKGGMSSVYRAWEPALEREIALKVLPAQFLHDPSFSERFEREAKVVAKLEHRNIVPIHAFGVDEGMPWMAMRLVSGESAASLCAAGALPPERVVAILRDVAEAIDYAHSHGVLHRDVKPPNILLDGAGHAYLADFGIARIVAGGDEATQTGAIMGTPKYMSPEQTRGDRVDHRCDVYSLGIVAYEMLTGKAPFSGATPMNIAVKHLMDPVPAPDPDLMAPPLAAAVLKCLAKQPEDRYDSAGEFLEALEAGLREVQASPAPRPGAADRAPIESASAPQAPTSPPPPRTRPPRAPERTPTRPAPARPRRLGVRASSLPTRALALGAGLVLLTGGVAALAWLRPSAPAPGASSEPTPPPPPTIAADVDAAGPEASIAPAPQPLTSAGTLELFERVCEEGDAASCERLALAYREEGRDASDQARAPALLSRACEGGATGACLALARLYAAGDGVLRNLARAVALFDQACREGEVEGCYELGLLYRSGRGVSADEARARQLLQGACDAGVARACAGVDPTQ